VRGNEMKGKSLAFLGLIGIFGNSVVGAQAADFSVAVASNFMVPMQSLIRAFEQETGHRAIPSFGATGKLYAQIKHGAPFEVFFSADQTTPQRLVHEGAAFKDTQVTYAIGKLVLWTRRDNHAAFSESILKAGSFRRLSIANPKLAPYGAAARQVMEGLGVWDLLQGQLVMGENITQAHQFVASGNADLGFVAFSQIPRSGANSEPEGGVWVIPQKLYSPLKQDAVLLRAGKSSAAAKSFLEFVKTKRAQTLIAATGYDPVL